jgi:hypothetical protein
VTVPGGARDLARRADHTPPGGYECARAWSALTAAHARVAGRLAAALDRLDPAEQDLLARALTRVATQDTRPAARSRQLA